MDDPAPEILGKYFLKPLSVTVECGPGQARCGITKDERIHGIRYDDLKQASNKTIHPGHNYPRQLPLCEFGRTDAGSSFLSIPAE